MSADSRSFCAGYLHPGDDGRQPLLTLFPIIGTKVRVLPLPGLPGGFRFIASSPDGKAIYGQDTGAPGPSDAIIKIEFRPTRQSIVRGSVGLGAVWYLTPSQQSDRIFVSGWSNKRGIGEEDAR